MTYKEISELKIGDTITFQDGKQATVLNVDATKKLISLRYTEPFVEEPLEDWTPPREVLEPKPPEGSVQPPPPDWSKPPAIPAMGIKKELTTVVCKWGNLQNA